MLVIPAMKKNIKRRLNRSKMEVKIITPTIFEKGPEKSSVKASAKKQAMVAIRNDSAISCFRISCFVAPVTKRIPISLSLFSVFDVIRLMKFDIVISRMKIARKERITTVE